MAVRDKRLKRKLDRARRLLGTRTDEETVERALDAVIAEDRIVRALRRARAAGGFEDVFGRS